METHSSIHAWEIPWTEDWQATVHGVTKESDITQQLNTCINEGFPSGSVLNSPPANAGDMGLIPGLGRSSGEGKGNPLQYSCLENPMDRGAQQATQPMGSQRVGHN